MKLNRLIKNKKGAVELLNVIRDLVLVLVFAFIMFTFIDYAGSRSLVYEQTYAKQIALMIDNSRPEMAILLDVSEGLEIAKKEGADLSKAFFLKDGRVWVDLGRGGGYSSGYFSNYDVNLKLVGNDLSIGIINNKENEKAELTDNNIQEINDNTDLINDE